MVGERGSKLVSDSDPNDDQVVQPETIEHVSKSESDCDSVVYPALVTPCKQVNSGTTRADLYMLQKKLLRKTNGVKNIHANFVQKW